MQDNDSPTDDWIQRAIDHPSVVFAGPEELAASTRLTREQKERALRSWQYDAAELAVAQEEGMDGPEDGMLRRVLLALADVTGEEVENVAPSKQHGPV